MPKVSPTIRFVEDNAQVVSGLAMQRLYFPDVRRKVEITYEEVSRLLARDNATRPTVFLPDTNFITRHNIDESVWSSLLSQQIVVTERVWEELIPWRVNPFYNRDLLPVFEAAKATEHTSIVFDDSSMWGWADASRWYYVHMLCHRKQMAKDAVDDFIEANGREPNPKELERLFNKLGIERDREIFKKGYREIIKAGNITTDEELVCTAPLISFMTGRNTTILTRDQDVFDQFFKLMGLLTYQYQATLFADRFADGPTDFETKPMPCDEPDLEYCFQTEESFLVKKPVDPDSFVKWLLPSEHEPIRIRCYLLTGEPSKLFIQTLEFIAERGMYRLWEAKGLTLGLNTDRFVGQKNCHVVGYPRGIENPRQWCIIAKDNQIKDSSSTLKFARLDVGHASRHGEVMLLSSRITR